MMTDADYADNLALLANTPAPIESLLHSQEQTAGIISHYVNINKTEYMCRKKNAPCTLEVASF